MPRKLRVQFPVAIYHVMSRGDRGRGFSWMPRRGIIIRERSKRRRHEKQEKLWSDPESESKDTTHGSHFAAHDGNGNVALLVNAADSSVSAVYEHGPFGELLRATGPMAFRNPFRFSTKYMDDETGLYYYGYRYYDPSTGRWLSRDPFGENGGGNLYGFVFNSPTYYADVLGLAPVIDLLPSSVLSCCDDKTIAAGEKTLRDKFNRISLALKNVGAWPVNPGRDGFTCKNSSCDILSYMTPAPKCWNCMLELRKDAKLPGDHQVIICKSYNSEKDPTKKKEILFDWWGDNYSSDTQYDHNPRFFRVSYPVLMETINNPFYTDCNGNLWSPSGASPSPPGFNCSYPQNPGIINGVLK